MANESIRSYSQLEKLIFNYIAFNFLQKFVFLKALANLQLNVKLILSIMLPFKTTSFKTFTISYIFLFVIACIILVFIDKGDMVLFLNKIANPSLDAFFKTTTQLGLGGVFAIPIIIMLFHRYSYAISGTIALIFTGLFTYLGKQVLFRGMPRPTGYFTNNELSYFIDGFTYHSQHSFPSGHTMTAFALALFTLIIINKKDWAIPILLIAVIIGISRIYLLQHFFMDVVAGSALGIICTIIGVYIGVYLLEKKYPKLALGLPVNFKKK